MHLNQDLLRRREFLGVLATLAAASPASLRAQAPAMYRRMNLSDPAAASSLQSYKKAIGKMLSLPPTDPRNWYRLALTHTLDCPHYNWWFLPWHRGYLGWFEQICRDLSGDTGFALPYWDWTAQPYVPPELWQDVLNPSNPAFLPNSQEFYKQFQPALEAFWKSLSNSQRSVLKQRSFNSIDDVWKSINAPKQSMFFPRANARSLTVSNPCLDPGTNFAVGLVYVLQVLQTDTFAGFASSPAANHSMSPGGGLLEVNPHGLVHKCVSGFMSQMLSPVDPLFYTHHANVDRLWDIWTRRQAHNAKPTLPEGDDLKKWQPEPFLFFVDPQTKPVTKITAGDYATIGDFNYDYQPGSAESEASHGVPFNQTRMKAVTATITHKNITLGRPATSHATVPDKILNPPGIDTVRPLFARITLETGNPQDLQFAVLVNPPDGSQPLGPDFPGYAGTLAFFGAHHSMGSVAFTVPLEGTIQRLRDAHLLRPEGRLQIDIAAMTRGAALQPLSAVLRELTIETL